MARVNRNTLQNRVDPFGNIHATPARGTMFGNRGGCFHTADQLLRKRHWASDRWICCLLDFKGRHRELMLPGRYTELFFLDEATAFAAGHRPCMECRREDALRFVQAWSRAHLPPSQKLRTISHIDQLAHRERLGADARQRTRPVRLSTLPDGVFVTVPDEPETPLLLWRGALRPWSFEGYGSARPRPGRDDVTLLTPPSFAAAFAAGYLPNLHGSAG